MYDFSNHGGNNACVTLRLTQKRSTEPRHFTGYNPSGLCAPDQQWIADIRHR